MDKHKADIYLTQMLGGQTFVLLQNIADVTELPSGKCAIVLNTAQPVIFDDTKERSADNAENPAAGREIPCQPNSGTN